MSHNVLLLKIFLPLLSLAEPNESVSLFNTDLQMVERGHFQLNMNIPHQVFFT